MFLIINNGELKGFCEKPRYVKNKNGVFVECEKEEAEKVALKGIGYDLSETIVRETDSAEFAFDESIKLSSVNDELTDSEDALCSFSEDVDARIAEIEDALCEISKEE